MTPPAERPPRKRKPTVAVRIANRLGTLAPEQVKALIHATGRLRKGQLEGSGDDLREGMREQREALAQLSEAAGRAAVEEGVNFTLALQRRVQETVRSAATSDPEALSKGTLEQELQSTGFEGLLGAAPAPRAVPAAVKKDDEEQRRKAAEEKREQARQLAAAEKEAMRLTERADNLAQTAEAAEEHAAAARKEADEAREAAGQAAARALELRQKA